MAHGAFAASNTNAVTKPDNQLNVVLAIPLSQIIEDKNQPRKDFHDENWQDFISDIKRRGVQTPIHLRPAIEGIYTIIHGARRYRASLEAGLSTIAAIVQQDALVFDDYSQVLENTKRANMAAMDIALFIKKRITAGDSKGKIAEHLSESASYISFHLALTEMPALVETAYRAGKVKGAQLVYQLNKLYYESPQLTESIINHHDEITNALIIQARKSLAADDETVAKSPVATQTLPVHNPDSKESASPKQTNPSKIKKPLLLAYFQNNQSCVVMLYERPTEAGFVWIKLDDTGESIEVLAEQVKLSVLTEALGETQ